MRGVCVYGVWCACVVCVVCGVWRVYVCVCVCGVSGVVCACVCLTRHENQWPKRLQFLCESNENPYPPRESVSQDTWNFYVDWCVMCMVCDVCVRCVLCGVRMCV